MTILFIFISAIASGFFLFTNMLLGQLGTRKLQDVAPVLQKACSYQIQLVSENKGSQ